MKAQARTGVPPMAVPVEFRLEDFLPYRLSVAASRVSRMCSRRYSAAYGLTIPEWRVLATIGRFGTLSPSAVTEWTAMDKVKVSRAAASLVARGLVRQMPDPNDGRGRRLRLTRKGTMVHQGVVPLAQELETTLAGGLSRWEWSVLNKALTHLNVHLQNIDGPDQGDELD
jgi:DNA-binding MarR family transcriptional regulator